MGYQRNASQQPLFSRPVDVPSSIFPMILLLSWKPLVKKENEMQRQAWLLQTLACLAALHAWSSARAFHTCRTRPRSVQLTKLLWAACGAPPVRATAFAPSVNTHPANRLQGQLHPLVNLGRRRKSGLKKKNKRVKESKAAAFLWSSSGLIFFSLKSRFRSSLSSRPFALKWQIGTYTEVIPGQLTEWSILCPTSPHPQQRDSQKRPASPEAAALCTGDGQCQPKL